ncbi:MAG TPA: hypothetical protein ENK18_15955 [Deltaproteobacteria bacterium]|nr:hypothetical protein [Deltaproteobacteria bacterium]
MLLTTLLSLAPAAHAAPTLNGEAVVAIPFDESSPDLGLGLGLRAGVPLGLVAVQIVPEAGLTAWTAGDLLLVPELGARVRFGKLIEPGVYGHALFPLREGYQPGWDAGVSLDLTAVPKLDVGLQGGVLSLGGGMAPTVGLSVGLKL